MATPDRRTDNRRPSHSGGAVFTPTVRIAKISGIEIGINWTWLGIFALIVWSLAANAFPAAAPNRPWGVYLAMGLAAAVAFFASLLLHELGHALQARREGVQIDGITLWLFGGVARFAGQFPSAGAEFRIAIAGPVVTAVLAVLFAAAAAGWPQPGAVASVFAWLAYINAALLFFNLIPAFPLDGGRVLRAALWARTGDLITATHRAARVSRMLAFALVALGIIEVAGGQLGGLWLALIGWFVLEAGRAEEQQTATHRILHDISVGALMTTGPVTVELHDSLAQVAGKLAGTARHTAYPVVDDGEVCGLFRLQAFAEIDPAHWTGVTVAETLRSRDQLPVFTPQMDAEDAAAELAAAEAGRGIVMDRGVLVGVLSMTDLVRALRFGTAV